MRREIRKKFVCIAVAASFLMSAAIMTSCSSGSSTDSEYDELIENAEDYADRDKLKKAIAAYEDAIELDPGRAEAYLALAELYVENGQLEDAEAILRTGKKKTKDEDIIDYLEEVQQMIEEASETDPTEPTEPGVTPEIIISATPSDTPTPEPTQAQPAPGDVKSAAYAAYWDVLDSFERELDRYADHYHYSADKFVTVDDFNDDGIPDLLFMSQPGTEEYESANLHIYTYDPAQDKAVEVVCYYGLDFMAASGGIFTVFSLNDSDEIGIMGAGGDEDWYISVSLRTFETDGSTQITDDISYESTPNWTDDGDYSDTTVVVTHNDQVYGQDYYDNYIATLAGRVDKILLSNEDEEWNMFDWDTWNTIAMTPDEAMSFLAGNSSGDYSAIAGTYWFSSGAGAWASQMTIKPDGTFDGTYYDQDYATEDEDYDVIMYMCEFEGSFSDIRQTGDLTYTMQLAELKYLKSEADSYIEEIEGVRIYYAYGLDAYGLDDAGTIEVYMPGYLKDDMPESAFMWYDCMMRYTDGDQPDTTVICLYNVNGEQAWTREY